MLGMIVKAHLFTPCFSASPALNVTRQAL